ncbi:MAG TPA: PEGA domain-containing protein [Tepidisphaeraceae bacterium]|nr:PEGA domain-containing protein [Tepidisphaeraceae bacterium]
MRNLVWAGLMILMVSAGGCAKLMRGDSQKMKFDTEPEGALVKIGDKEYTTPAEVVLKRKDKHEVTVSKAGYRTVRFELTAKWDGLSLTSAALPGGSVWFATDTATGADRRFYKLEKIKLEPTTDPNAPELVLTQYRGKLYTEEQFKQVMEEERKYREYYFE